MRAVPPGVAIRKRASAIAAGLGLCLGSGLLGGCAAGPRPGSQGFADEGLPSILGSHSGLRTVMDAPERFRFQAVLGLVEERPDGRLGLMQYGFRVGAEYLYPASTVKLFGAVAALERLAELRRETGLPLDVDTPLVFHPLFEGEVLEDVDPTNLDGGRITVRHEIRKLFLVSDNQAFNRLYELVGQDRLAASLARAGLGGARIVHRLSEPRTVEENRRFPRIDFLGREGDGKRVLYTLPERISQPLPPGREVAGLKVGRAHVGPEDRVVEEPLDFAEKNRISLADLQRGLCMVVRPDVDCGGPGFQLSEADRALLLEAMSQLPRESRNPLYDPAEYPDSYVKYLLPGLARVIPPERLRIFNKIGQAYGFTTDNAWVTDTATGRSFFLAATLYANDDGVLNDDQYDYATVALPFLADLGEAAARRLLDPGTAAADDAASGGEEFHDDGLQLGQPVGDRVPDQLGCFLASCGIELSALRLDRGFEVRIPDGVGHHQVDRPSDQRLQPLLELEVPVEQAAGAAIEVHQHVDVAVRPELVGEDRAEQIEPTDSQLPAEGGHCRPEGFEIEHVGRLFSHGFILPKAPALSSKRRAAGP